VKHPPLSVTVGALWTHMPLGVAAVGGAHGVFRKRGQRQRADSVSARLPSWGSSIVASSIAPRLGCFYARARCETCQERHGEVQQVGGIVLCQSASVCAVVSVLPEGVR
jgi:hypothetical protein